jgi:uncharacterized protein (DUF488 family)
VKRRPSRSTTDRSVAPRQARRRPTAALYTIGHSTRTNEAFLELLLAHRIAKLVDVRTIPRSRRHPHFNRETLARSLAEASIEYRHAPALGGLRRPRRDSINTGWRNASFRGYADHMQTPEFEQALEALMAGAPRERTAIMCAEAVPWRCHRSLIADALLAGGIRVAHIMTGERVEPHALTRFARVDGTRVTYPSARPLDLPFDRS